MNIYDTITADQVEDGDQVAIYGDYLEGITVEDLGAVICLKGNSDITGDSVTYFLAPTAYVDLWAV